MKKVSIVIPCFNEEETIPLLEGEIKRLYDITPKEQYVYELVFVDDGSKDDTYKLLRERFSEYEGVKILRHQKNLGFGRAIRTGFEAAGGEFVVCYDSDCTCPVEDIAAMLSMMDKDTDIVSGSPLHPSGDAGRVLPRRLMLSRGALLLYKLVLGKKAKNITSFSFAVRVYRKTVIQGIDFKSSDFLAAAEIMVLALKKGYRIREFPATLGNRKTGESKMKNFSTIVSHLKFLAKIVTGQVK